jgi:hypothetical protein
MWHDCWLIIFILGLEYPTVYPPMNPVSETFEGHVPNAARLLIVESALIVEISTATWFAYLTSTAPFLPRSHSSPPEIS